MARFTVDDDLAFHSTIVAAGNAAVGLWVRAAAWSSAHLTDGFVPQNIVAALGTTTQARALCRAGLWNPEPETDGYRFVDWHQQRQPTRADTEHKRARARERMRRTRSVNAGDVRANTDDSSGEVRAKFARTSQADSDNEPPHTNQYGNDSEHLSPHVDGSSTAHVRANFARSAHELRPNFAHTETEHGPAKRCIQHDDYEPDCPACDTAAALREQWLTHRIAEARTEDNASPERHRMTGPVRNNHRHGPEVRPR